MGTCTFFDRRRAAQTGCKLLAVLSFVLAAWVASVVPTAGAEPAAGQQTPAEQTGQVTDAVGDPLPPGAMFRFGTVRFRPPTTVRDIVLAPDEKTLITIGDKLIAWDVENGKERWRVDSQEFGYRSNGVSYGGQALVFSADSTHFYTVGNKDEVVVWETLSGQRERISLSGANPRQNVQFAGNASIDVTADGKTIALGGPAGLNVVSAQDFQAYEITNDVQPEQDQGRDRLKFGGPYCTGRFSPKGDLLAVVSSDTHSAIRLCDPKTGTEQRRITLKGRLVRMAFSPDGSRIAATERDNAVRLYDVASAKEVWSHIVELKNPTENYTSAIAYSPDGKLVAVCATDDIIHLIDTATGNETAALAGHTWYPWSVAFTADSKMLYSSGWDGAIRRWDVATAKQLPPPKGIRGSAVVTASPDGTMYAYQDDLGVVHIVDAESGAERQTLQLEKTRYGVLVFSSDSTRLAAGGGRGDQIRVVVWKLDDGAVEREWSWPRGKDPKSTIESLQFSPDGKRLAAAVFRQNASYLWDLPANRQIAELPHQSIYGLSFSSDSKILATAGWDRAIHTWSADTGEARGEYGFEAPENGQPNNGDLRMYTVVFAPHGGLMATAHLDGSVRLWHANDMTLQNTFRIVGRFYHGSIAFSPNGLWLATGSSEGSLSIWDPLNGQMVHEVGKHQDGIYTAAFGRRGQTLLSGGSDGVDYVWDLRPRDLPPNKSQNDLWNELIGDDSGAAYKAMWTLADKGEQSIPLLADKLRTVSSVTPIRTAPRDATGKVAQPSEPGALGWVAARRAVAVLSDMNSAQAVDALRALATHAASAEVKQFATDALRSASRSQDNQ